MRILAIDPGNEYSGWAIIDEDYRPVSFGKTKNEDLCHSLNEMFFDRVVIEMVASYGMPVGKTVFDTCVWIGRFMEFIILDARVWERDISFATRKEYVTALCGSSRAKDANVIQYLIDRFAPNTPNRGKGTKKEPGWFYGFKADVWQAYAIAVYAMDALNHTLSRCVTDGRVNGNNQT